MNSSRVCEISSERAVVPGAFALPLLLALFFHPRPMETPMPAPTVNPYVETTNGCPSAGGLIIGAREAAPGAARP